MELHFTRTNGPADDAIDALISLVGDVRHADMVREIILAGLKSGQEIRNRADMKLMSSTLKEMRFTTRIFAPYEEIKKVTVFGSARTKPEEPIYQMARLFGRKLSDAGYMVITGGGPGIMQAVNEGAGNEHSFGVNIRLPFEQKPNPVIEDSPRTINYKYFFNRKVAFLKEGDAIVLFPGGFGTLDEAMETLTLIQTGKHNPMPLVLLDESGGTYWARWLGFLEKELLGRGYISSTDLHLFDMTDSVEEAVRKIDHFYRRYHSIRYVGNRLAIRLSSPMPPQRAEHLKEEFSDILRPPGELFFSKALPEEEDEPGIAHLPRLVLDFNRKDFSRLHRLIDRLND
ncbi:MAG: TIGR00730 family Rossman fold protein [Desulfatiglandaceae bacterium]